MTRLGHAGRVRCHQAGGARAPAEEQGVAAPAVAVGTGPSPGNVIAPAPVVGAPAGDDLSGQLQQLASLHSQGILTDQEFADAKAKLIGG